MTFRLWLGRGRKSDKDRNKDSVCREAEGKVTEETSSLWGLPGQCSVSKAHRKEECKEGVTWKWGLKETYRLQLADSFKHTNTTQIGCFLPPFFCFYFCFETGVPFSSLGLLTCCSAKDSIELLILLFLVFTSLVLGLYTYVLYPVYVVLRNWSQGLGQARPAFYQLTTVSVRRLF